MRHHTPTALKGQSLSVSVSFRRFALAGALTACVAGGVLAHPLARSASRSRTTHLSPVLADGCTSSGGPCLLLGM